MKVEQLTDPGGHVGPPGPTSKNTGSGLEDSDSGLDTTSTSSVRSNSKTSNTADSGVSIKTPEKTKVVELTPRKKPPFMGLALKRNPDLSEIARNEQKLCYECYECGSKMAKRQPLTKTNGILFMKNREADVMENYEYDSVADRAFTRSEIVQSWHFELQDHREYCTDELNQMYFYQKKYNLKYGVKVKSKAPKIEEPITNNDEKATTITKIQKKTARKDSKIEI